ncbi:MAG: chromosomal replication initiator protein DnaA [Dehalococcoidia bacterium]|nr:chromosomal replication initiator protein DnaA [Dehalococcoidia bacterium]
MAVQPVQPEEQERLWEQVLTSVKSRLGSPQAFDTWFRPIVARELNPETVDLEVPNAFFVDWIHEHHLNTLRVALHEVMRTTPDIRFTPREPSSLPPAPSSALESRSMPPAPSAPAAAPVAAPPAGGKLWLESQLNPRLTFDSYVVGGSNRFTHAACRAVSERPGQVYNPLFIFGGSGLGKTHLLHAVGHTVKRTKPDARVHYVPAERFTNEMIFAIQHGQTLAFRNKYRNVDVLLIDDVQFLAGKESTQEEFFYTFNALRDAHKQIVVTADKAPKDIEGLEERLISRFNQGLIADVKHPDLETRIAILRNRCELEGAGFRLQDDVLLLLADRVRGNVRDLEGCLVRLLAVASLTHQDITLELAEDVLSQYVNAEPDHLTPERILTAVSERFGVKTEAMLGQRRTQVVALPRQVAMYLLRQLTDLSLVEIGRVFGGRDHTTVLYACEKIARRINTEEAFGEKVNGLISTLAS